MNYISVSDFAKKNGLPQRTVRSWCAAGKINGAILLGKTWAVPEDALPFKKSSSMTTNSPLLSALRNEKEARLRGGIYHRTQIDLTYNSNHMEGSRLSHEQTRFIFETNTIGLTEQNVNVDDIIETTNHFRCIDTIIDKCEDKLSEAYIKELHFILKYGTSDSQKAWFAVGDYKKLPNEVGGNTSCRPQDVHQELKKLLAHYNSHSTKSFEDIIDFHQRFESIHPFQDGNGRVGRLIMFKECLANGFVPFIITEDLKYYYYRGLREWNVTKEYLLDTCLSAQDNYKAILDYFQIKY